MIVKMIVGLPDQSELASDSIVVPHFSRSICISNIDVLICTTSSLTDRSLSASISAVLLIQ